MKQKHRFLLIFNLCFALFAWGQKFQPNPLYGSTFNRGIYFFGLGVPQDTATLDNVQKLYPHIARIGDNTFFWSVVLQKWVPEVAGAGTETDPIYSANGVPKTRQITINGFTQDLTSDPNFTIPITLTETDPLYTANGVPKTRQVIINGMHQDLTADANFTIPIPPNIVLSGDATGTSTSVGALL
jgi:hypothetical protein